MNIEELLTLLELNNDDSFAQVNDKYTAFLAEQEKMARIKKMGGVNPFAPQATATFSVEDLQNAWSLINSEMKYNQYKTTGQIPEQETQAAATPTPPQPQPGTLSSLTKDRVKSEGRRLPTRKKTTPKAELTQTIDTPDVLDNTSPEPTPDSPIRTQAEKQQNKEPETNQEPVYTTAPASPIRPHTPPVTAVTEQPDHELVANKPVTICIYSDFDGTATKRTGERTVFTDFYQSMLQIKIPNNYTDSPMKSHEEMVSLFTAKFGEFHPQITYKQPDADFLITHDALDFFHTALNSENISVNFVTKNRAGYIKAMLAYQGFSAEELSKLTIMDSGNKYLDVTANLCIRQRNPSFIYIFDDSLSDLQKMLRAANEMGDGTEKIVTVQAPAGLFRWNNYLQLLQVKASTRDNTLNDAPITKADEPVIEPVHVAPEESSDATTQIEHPPVVDFELVKIQKHRKFINDTMLNINFALIEFAQSAKNSTDYLPAENLVNTLRGHLATYKEALNKGPENIKRAGDAFLKQCTDSIIAAKSELNQTLSWGDRLVNLLKAIANVVIKNVNSITGSQFTLFKPAVPTLMPAIEQLETRFERSYSRK